MRNNSLSIFLALSVMVHGFLVFKTKSSKLLKTTHFSDIVKNEVRLRTTLNIKNRAVKKVVKKIKKAGKKKVVLKKSTPKPVTNNLIEKRLKKVNKLSTGQRNQKSRYLNQIRQRILEEKIYPRVAKRQRKQGIVDIYFEVSYPNKIGNIRIQKESPHQVLNNSALQTIEDLDDLPVMPEVLKTETLKVAIPINYELL